MILWRIYDAGNSNIWRLIGLRVVLNVFV